ncbi:MAG: CotH kinase family protein [Oscillospiraceae bacterium]|nr:CotH kinase family protein [Oscillospiraceae bacterium]
MKRKIALALMLVLILTLLPTTSTGGDALASAPAGGGVIIHQVYGAGTPMDGAVSHSFIELFNPTENPVDLNNWSVRVANGLGDWNTLPLTGKSIGAKSSFLIVADKYVNTGASVQPRYVVPSWDMAWDIEISNRAFSAELLNGQVSVDLLGVLNDPNSGDAVNHFTGSPLAGISKQRAARRTLETYLGGEDNNTDYQILDYRATGISDTRLAEVKPRWSGDGAWGAGLVIPEYVPESQKLVFSHEAGLYASGFSLSLSTGYSGGIIRYTTDGNDPAPDSQQYTEPLTIAERTNTPNVFSVIANTHNMGFYREPTGNVFKGNVIKAQVFSPDGTPLTRAVTKSYIINSKYDGLPVLSLTVNRDDFFDRNTGIYRNTTQNGVRNYDQRGAEWERPCHLEFFEPDGTLGFSQSMGVRIHGGYTRQFAQKSLRFYARAEYDPGKNTLEYDLFDGAALALDGTTVESFRRFIARNSGNDNQNAFMRDALVHRASRGLNFAVQDSRFAVVLLNGEFWGLYELRERIDEYFINYKYKLGSTNVAILENGEDEDNEFPADAELFRQMNEWFTSNPDLSSPALYRKAQTFLDIDNLIDYFIVESYTNNLDWPANNNVMWRFQAKEGYPAEGAALTPDDGRWRYALKDLDQTFGLYGQNIVSENQFTRLFDTTGNLYYHNGGYDFAAKPWATLYFRTLCTNPDFVKQFVNRYCDVMNTNLRHTAIEAIADEMAGQIGGLLGWGGEHPARWMWPMFWQDQVQVIKTFSSQRQSYVLSHMRAQPEFNLAGSIPIEFTVKTDKARGHLRVNGIDILPSTLGVNDPARWSGTYFTGSTQTVTAVPQRGFTFEKFIVGSQEFSQNPLSINLSNAVTVEAVFVRDVDAGWVNTFGDVSENDWFYNAVAFANANSLFAGYSTTHFAPNDVMTRAMFVTVLHKLEGRPAPKGTVTFTDVPDDWYTNAVLWAAENSVVTGHGNGIFKPADPISRQEAAVMLFSYAKYKKLALPDKEESYGFTDDDAIDWWAEKEVKALAHAGVFPTVSAFRPTDKATRAEVAEMFMYFLQKLGSL